MSRKKFTVSDIEDKIKEYEKILEDHDIPSSRRHSAQSYLYMLRKRIGLGKKKLRRKKRVAKKKPETDRPVVVRERYTAHTGPVVARAPKTREEMIRKLWDSEDEKE